jgi:hypothetical protein
LGQVDVDGRHARHPKHNPGHVLPVATKTPTTATLTLPPAPIIEMTSKPGRGSCIVYG